MKRLCTVLLVALLAPGLARPALGQTKVAGAKIGIVSGHINTNFYDILGASTGARTAFSAGLYFGVDLHRRFRLQVEAQYVRKGMEWSFSGLNGEDNFDYLELLFPATFMIPLEGGKFVPRLFAGPAIALELSCTVVVEAGGRSYKNDCRGTPKVPFGGLVGAGSDLWIGVGVLSLDVVYNVGLTHLFGFNELFRPDGPIEISAKHRTLQVLVGYGFVID
jgi:hypothetical protein